MMSSLLYVGRVLLEMRSMTEIQSIYRPFINCDNGTFVCMRLLIGYLTRWPSLLMQFVRVVKRTPEFVYCTLILESISCIHHAHSVPDHSFRFNSFHASWSAYC